MKALQLALFVLLLATGISACTQNGPRMNDTKPVQEPDAQITKPAPAKVAMSYLCGTTKADATFAGDAVTLTVNGKTYALSRVRAASGAKYESGVGSEYVMFWAKAEMALLEIGDTSFPECRKQANINDMINISSIIGKKWIVEDISHQGVIDNSHMTLNFDETGRLYGRSGCNRYTTDYSLTGNSLSLGNIAVTRMACAPALMNQEDRFLEVLNHADRLELTTNGALVVHGTNDQTVKARSE